MRMPPSILVIDDDPVTCHLTKRQLERGGFEVVFVGSGRLGLEAVKARRFTLIILDICMPEYSGLTFLRDVHAELKDVPPIIVFTAAQDASIAEECLLLGAEGFLLKPVRASWLMDEIRRVLQRVEQRSEEPE